MGSYRVLAVGLHHQCLPIRDGRMKHGQPAQMLDDAGRAGDGIACVVGSVQERDVFGPNAESDIGTDFQATGRDGQSDAFASRQG